MQLERTPDYFAVLGLRKDDPEVTNEEVGRAFRARASQVHPDRTRSNADIGAEMNLWHTARKALETEGGRQFHRNVLAEEADLAARAASTTENPFDLDEEFDWDMYGAGANSRVARHFQARSSNRSTHRKARARSSSAVRRGIVTAVLSLGVVGGFGGAGLSWHIRQEALARTSACLAKVSAQQCDSSSDDAQFAQSWAAMPGSLAISLASMEAMSKRRKFSSRARKFERAFAPSGR